LQDQGCPCSALYPGRIPSATGRDFPFFESACILPLEWVANGSVDMANIKVPIIRFVFGNKGPMFNLTLEGSKMSKLKK
jgi:hypothetical protein